MLDFGFSEILLTSAIALVVLGPEKLPRVARQVGNWVGRARLMARQLSDQLEREVNAEELLRHSARPGVSAPPLPADVPPAPSLPPVVAPATASVTSLPVATGDRTATEPSTEPTTEPSSESAPAASGSPIADQGREPHPTSPAGMHPNSPPAMHPNSPPAMHPNSPAMMHATSPAALHPQPAQNAEPTHTTS